ncbi:MAG: ribbon-helix-helix domain-containing protein [Inquilinus limosus]|uniref:Ribbon-helix-helix domain-containing protein n=1 Tax=Inquilinus limosus TaxID=171674 RepID=A0A952KHS2_9PROT|nr:ribbon-helix-helix domain-containing protein [Inquilinus limosus]
MSICRNVTVAGRRTSVRMEVVFWDGLMEICAREQIGLNEICTRIDADPAGAAGGGAGRRHRRTGVGKLPGLAAGP